MSYLNQNAQERPDRPQFETGSRPGTSSGPPPGAGEPPPRRRGCLGSWILALLLLGSVVLNVALLAAIAMRFETVGAGGGRLRPLP